MTRKDRLIAALAALPQDNPKIGAKELDQIANAIQIGAGLGRIGEMPRARKASPKTAEAELVKYAKLCRALGVQIQSMSQTSLGHLKAHAGDALHPLQLFDHLSRAIENGRRAFHDLPEELPDDQLTGAPKKVSASRATRQAARAYQEITGSKPTRVTIAGKAGGPYLEYLGQVFAALEITASPEAQARAMEESRASKD